MRNWKKNSSATMLFYNREFFEFVNDQRSILFIKRAIWFPSNILDFPQSFSTNYSNFRCLFCPKSSSRTILITIFPGKSSKNRTIFHKIIISFRVSIYSNRFQFNFHVKARPHHPRYVDWHVNRHCRSTNVDRQTVSTFKSTYC